MKELTIQVYGRVQGVRFRTFTKEQALKTGINGYVKNDSEGSIRIIAQGDEASLRNFLDSIQRGSTFAKVEGLSYRWTSPQTNYKNFFIMIDSNTLEDQTSSFINLGKKILGIKPLVPIHVAIIPDGNRRWAKKRGLDPTKGHEKGGSLSNLIPLLEESKRIGIKYLTFWAFSTENWKRDKKEVDFLFNIVKKSLSQLKQYAIKNKIRFRHVGRRDRLPNWLLKEFQSLEKETEQFSNLNVQICLDYGGRDEITRVINKILQSGVREVKEDEIAAYLDSAGIPDPDLIIRTSGEQRTSGLMPFQSVYSELYFCPVDFPDFNTENLKEAVEEFSRRKRNFGK